MGERGSEGREISGRHWQVGGSVSGGGGGGGGVEGE